MLQKILFVITIAGFFSCDNTNSDGIFEISGIVKNSDAKKIYLEETPMASGQRVILDSAQLRADGSFHLKTNTKQESLFSLYLDNAIYPLLPMVNDAAKITVTADVKNVNNPIQAEGSSATASLNDFIKTGIQKWNEINGIGEKLDSLIKAGAPDSIIGPLNDMGRNSLSNFKRHVSEFIKNAKSPTVAVFPLNDRYGRLFDVQEYDSLISLLQKKFPAHNGIAATKKMFKDQAAAIQQQASGKWTGKHAPAFALPDLEGNIVALSSFLGKYVLVDFWASWCGPCRLENPNVVAAYHRFKNKNFTILGVSLDKDKNAWQQAIQKDGLAWTNISDLKFWESIVVPLYNIEGIPFNVLLDPSGKIIAENLRGQQLDKKLQEVLQ